MMVLTGVKKTYPLSQGRLSALQQTDLSVKAGEFIVIVGRSGAGKSTLLGIAGGLLHPTVGDVQLNSQSLWTIDDRTRARIRAEQIGFVFQNASVISSLTLLENVMLASVFAQVPAETAQRRARLLLTDVGLGDRAGAYPDQISGGEKRRVAVASALINAPALVLADEPTGELDPDTEVRIMALLQQAHEQGTTILLVTHNHDLIRYAQRAFIMEQGRLIEQEQS
jgi:ABC-type lipoprotein export system ATPase subunit